MDRRSFFCSLLPAAALPAAALAPAPAQATARMRIPECECGWVFAVESDWNYKSDLSTEHLYMICVNPACSRHNVPYAIPRVALTPADPVAVAHVQEAERKK